MTVPSKPDRVFLEAVFLLQCTSKMNAYYYEARLAAAQRASTIMEFVLAAAASGGAFAGLVWWTTTEWGKWTWAALTGLSAVMAVVKPIYAPGRRIELFTRQHQSYYNNFFALQKLVFMLKQSEEITDEHRKRYDTIYDRHVQLAADDEAVPSSQAQRRAEQRAKDAMPPDDFWRHWFPIDNQEAGTAHCNVPAGVHGTISA